MTGARESKRKRNMHKQQLFMCTRMHTHTHIKESHAYVLCTPAHNLEKNLCATNRMDGWMDGLMVCASMVCMWWWYSGEQRGIKRRVGTRTRSWMRKEMLSILFYWSCLLLLLLWLDRCVLVGHVILKLMAQRKRQTKRERYHNTRNARMKCGKKSEMERINDSLTVLGDRINGQRSQGREFQNFDYI